MLRTTVTIDGSLYSLTIGTDTQALSNAAVDAARSQGGMITFGTSGGRTVRALVTAGTTLVFHDFEVVDDGPEPTLVSAATLTDLDW